MKTSGHWCFLAGFFISRQRRRLSFTVARGRECFGRQKRQSPYWRTKVEDADIQRDASAFDSKSDNPVGRKLVDNSVFTYDQRSNNVTRSDLVRLAARGGNLARKLENLRHFISPFRLTQALGAYREGERARSSIVATVAA